jgi:signal transduction histidine kinase
MERVQHRYHPLKTGYFEKEEKSCKKGSLNEVASWLICSMERKRCFYRIPTLLLFAGVLGCSLYLRGQPLNKDSLLKRLTVSKEDTGKVLLLVNLARAFKNSNIAEAKRYCSDALALSNKLHYNRGRFLSLANEISLIRLEGADSLALEKCKSFVKQAEDAKDEYNIGAGYLNLGEVYDNTGDNEKAVEYSLKALAIAERLNRKDLLQDAYGSLQRVYISRTEFDKAVIYGKKAIDLAEEMKDKKRVVTQSYNLAFTYNVMKEFDQSFALSKEIIAICKEISEPRIESYALYNLCSISLRNEKNDDALKYGMQCLELARKNTDKGIEAASLAAIGSALIQLKKYKEAEGFILLALAIKEKGDDKLGIAEVKDILSNVYFAMGDPKKAYAYEREAEDFSDSYHQSILSRQSSDLEKKYETEKKNAQIKLQQAALRQKNTINYILFGGAAALLIISLLTYRNYRQKQNIQQQRISELETEKQLTATEAVLKGEEQERTRLAKDLHDGLGGMLSGIKYSFNAMKGNLIMTPENAQAFERSMDMLDSSIKEMRRVAHNMMPEALVKFGLDVALKDFCNDINQSGALQLSYQSIGMEDAEIHPTIAITVYRIVQELINNSIRHAEAKTAVVQVAKENDQLNITVEDDGKGFDVAALSQARGIGWNNIQNRVEVLKGKLDVRSQPGSGTSVFIEIKT